MSDPHTVIDEVDAIRAKLANLVMWLNARSAWNAALKTQIALVAVDDIGGSNEVDFEESYP